MRVHLILEANNQPERLAELARHGRILSVSRGSGRQTCMTGGTLSLTMLMPPVQHREYILGPVAVSPYELHPLKMGNALLTLNEIAEGRAHIGIAAGDGGTAMAMGFEAKRRLAGRSRMHRNCQCDGHR